jgi:hypothetical protein
MRLENRSRLLCRAERTLRCDFKTEVDFVPRGADFEMRLENRSRLQLPREVDFDMRL